MKQTVLIISFSFLQVKKAFELLEKSNINIVVLEPKIFKDWKEIDFVDYINNMEQKPIGMIIGADIEITESLLEKIPSVKYISLNCAGSDHIDINAINKHNVKTSNVPRQNFDAVADFIWGQILTLMRKIHIGDQNIRKGRWAEGIESSAAVSRKKLGLIGFGAIGKAVAKRAIGFDMETIVFNRTIYKELEKEYNVTFVDKDELFTQSEIIVITCPCTKETFHLINKRSIGKMKDNVFIINSSRGKIIDTEALEQALINNEIGGAALDVFEVEPLYESSLFRLDNVLLTPHLGGLADREIENVAVKSVENMIMMIENIMPESLLNKD